MLRTLLLILSISLIACESGNGFVYDHGVNKMKTNDETFSTQNIVDLIKYNLGVQQDIPSDFKSQKIIDVWGKQNTLNPIKLQYLFIIENNNNIAHMEYDGASFKFQIDSQDMLNQILNQDLSIASQIAQQYNLHTNPAYFYQTEGRFGKNQVMIFENQEGLQIVEQNSQKIFKIQYNLSQCASKFQNFGVDLENSQIFDNKQNYKIEKKESLVKFAMDLCTIGSLSEMVREDSNPTLLVFYIHSLLELENEKNYKILSLMMNQAIKKFQVNLQKQFKSDQVAGQVLFSKENLRFKETSSNRLLSEEEQKPKVGSTTQVGQVTMSNENIMIYIWFPITLLFGTLYILYSVFTMYVHRDSLIYAKFLTVDAK